MSLHLDLAEHIAQQFGERLDEPVEVKLDALIVRLDNGVVAELRVVSPESYAFAWAWGDAELRIDTAPVHRDLATFPNHLHAADGRIAEDGVTRCGADPWTNVAALIAVLLVDPLLDAVVP